MKYNGKSVKNSGLARRYMIRRPAKEQLELAELCRRWNDNEFKSEEYPIMWQDQVLFDHVKTPHKQNSWEYKIEYELQADRKPRYLILEGVCQEHVTGEFINEMRKVIWTGKVPVSRYYNITGITRLNHRRSKSQEKGLEHATR